MAHPYFDVPTPIVIGHRGCAGEAPENTLEAFEAGLRAGASILESDVHLSRDGIPVLIHDDHVERVTDGSGAVADLSLSELQALDAGYRFSPDGGATHPFRGCGIRIPTFEEALEKHPGVRFNIEIKAEDPASLESTVEIVTRQGREALTLLTVAEEPQMQQLRRHLAHRKLAVAQGACTADVVAVIRSSEAGEAPDTPAMALQIPAEFAGRPLVTPELVRHAHAHGIQIHVWTINEIDEMNELLDLGVDGLVTDYPGRLVTCLEERRGRGEG